MRHPKPTTVRLLEGSFRPDRHKPGVSLATSRPDVPSFLATDAAAIFNETADAIACLITAADRSCLAAFAFYSTEWQRLCEVVAEMGDLVPTGSGSEKANPLIAKRDECARLMASFGARLGLSPADRARIHSGGGGEDLAGWEGLIS